MSELYSRKYETKITLGVAPTKRSFLSMEEAKRQKDRFMAVNRSIKPGIVEIVDIDDICENGIMYRTTDTDKVIAKFRAAGIDALFIPHCDFGEEQVSASVAAALMVPTLIWGPRDERPNTDEARGRDTQCGMFACTKVLMRYGVRFSYIFNCATESSEFSDGYTNFIRTVAVLKALRGLRIAKFGARPGPFLSVTANEGDLMTKFGITTVPVKIHEVVDEATAIERENGEFFRSYLADLKNRMDCSAMPEDLVKRSAALKLAVKKKMLENNCTVGAMECWTAKDQFGVMICSVLGEMADDGYPISCETDVNGAVTMAILRACSLNEGPVFLADLTIRDPNNDNSELLWHCGCFPYSLKDPSCGAKLVNGVEQFRLRKGKLTVCRFDDLNGVYQLFAGEGKATTGTETNGTYVYLETENWKRWEEKFIFGPYIHHVGCAYGSYFPALREAARYLDIKFDQVDDEGPFSL